MGGLGSHMVDLTWVDVPAQQRHPTFAFAAVRGVLAKGRFGVARRGRSCREDRSRSNSEESD